ncbi:MAG: hypothetical protein PHX27_02660 [Candidatus ainarchaeum sp.]|nr:hypothetical protein [Candidatus ainarchaeum sp.]
MDLNNVKKKQIVKELDLKEKLIKPKKMQKISNNIINLHKEKILCVLLDDNPKYFKWFAKKPFLDFELNISYSMFSKIGKKYFIKIIFSKYSDYKKDFVKKYWFFDKIWKKSNIKIKPDLFFDKIPLTKKGLLIKKELSKKNIIFNSCELDLFCKDKFLQSIEFSDYSPKTFLIKNNASFLKSIKKISSKYAVLKPRFGLGSEGVEIIDLNKNFKKNIKKSFKEDFVLQEFIDTSKGIPKTKIKSTHDLRCVIINGAIEFCFVRMPKKGFIASIHRGANVISIDPPKQVFPLIKKIDFFMKKFGNRFYSIDLFFSKNKFYLIELNSKPGFGVGVEFGFVKKEEKLMIKIFENIILKHPVIKN